MKNKKIRSDKMNKFVDKGEPGEMFNEAYHAILDKMKIPKDVLDQINDGQYGEDLKPLYKSGYNFVFPSLFITMIRLQQQGRDFSIVFRSFGTDSDCVIKEFNAFCQGKHPLLTENVSLFLKFTSMALTAQRITLFQRKTAVSSIDTQLTFSTFH